MDKEWMRRWLPERPPDGYEEWIKDEADMDLEKRLLLFSAERVKVYPQLTELMELGGNAPVKTVWQSRCTCTVCGEDFVTKHVNNGQKGFLMWQGPDGCTYPVDPALCEPITDENEIEDFGYDSAYIELTGGDAICCPSCLAEVEALHRSRVRGGRRKQVLGCTVQNIFGYTAVVFWLTANRIDEFGCWVMDTYPRDAYVIGERGGLTRYRHTGGTGSFTTEYWLEDWVLASDAGRDSFSIPYHDWLSNNNRKVGGYVWREVPDLGGCTGEKTGLAEYIRQGGNYPVTYLKLWRSHKNVENLMKSGWGSLIEHSITRYTGADARVLQTDILGVDFTKKKPHEMLRMTKSDFRTLTQTGNIWRPGKFNEWVEYLNAGGKCSALEFDRYFESFGETGTFALIEMLGIDEKTDFPTVAAYLQKQNIPFRNARILRDARERAQAMNPGRDLTPEEMWPRHLMAVHDRLDELRRVEGDPVENRKLAAGFRHIVEVYGGLEWNDGELRILLPRGNEELVREGSVLRHCVGGYGKGHCEGNLIFFVRKYRRPERSYYTLNISMKGGAPKEIQLHGYGNETHGDHKQYRHKIPQKVRDFVDRWKREVLMPWWAQQINTKKKEKTA